MKKIIFAQLLLIIIAGFYTQAANSKPLPKKNKTEPVKKSSTVDDTQKSDDDDEKPEKKQEKNEEHKKFEKTSEEQKAKYIEETLDYGSHPERLDALNRIKLIKDQDKKNRLYLKLIDIINKEIDTDIRLKAISVASESMVKEAAPAIAERLNDDIEDIKIESVSAMQKLGYTASKDKLIELLKKQDLAKDSNLTEALIRTLGEFKAVELSQFMMDGISSNKTTKINKENMMIFFGRAGTKDVKDFLLKIYKNDDEEQGLRGYAINSIAKLELKETIPDIKEIIKQIEAYPFKKRQNHYNLYIFSVAALAKFGDEDAFPKLMNSLRSGNSNVRLKAVNLLKDLNDKRAIDILKYKMKYDSSIKVQKAAKEALRGMGVDVEEEEKLKKEEEKKQQDEAAKRQQAVKKEKNKK